MWYDVRHKLAEALDDCAFFRRFRGFSASEAMPERTAAVRYRKTLIAHGLDRRLSETVAAELKAQAVTVKMGTLVDATIIASAREADGVWHWVKHKSRAAMRFGPRMVCRASS